MAAARSVLAAFAALAASTLVACVDGTTPDCSDAAEGCAPSFTDGGTEIDTGVDAPSPVDGGADAGEDAAAPPVDASMDTGAPG